jgi:hypothetical protein
MSKTSLHFTQGKERRQAWGRKDEEYAADFVLVSRRTLTPEEYRIFNFHFLLGADWKLCTRKMKMSRGNFFHAVYRIQQRLGRVFSELKPYGLFPLDEYFATTVNSAKPIPMPLQPPPGCVPVQPRLRRAA